MTKIWCGYYDGNDKSKKLQEKLGFAFCFSDEKLADLNTGAKCIRHINLLEKEKWEALKQRSGIDLESIALRKSVNYF